MKKLYLLILCFFIGVLSGCTTSTTELLDIKNDEANTKEEVKAMIENLNIKAYDMDNDVLYDKSKIIEFENKYLLNDEYTLKEDFDEYDQHDYGYIEFINLTVATDWINSLATINVLEEEWHTVNIYTDVDMYYFVNEDSFYLEMNMEESSNQVVNSKYIFTMREDILIYEKIITREIDGIVISTEYSINHSEKGIYMMSIERGYISTSNYDMINDTYQAFSVNQQGRITEIEVDYNSGTYTQFSRYDEEDYIHYYFGKIKDNDFVVTLSHTPEKVDYESFYRFTFDTKYINGWTYYKDHSLHDGFGEIDAYAFTGGSHSYISSPFDIYIEIDSRNEAKKENFEAPYDLSFDEYDFEEFMSDFEMYLDSEKRIDVTDTAFIIDGIEYNRFSDMNNLFEQYFFEDRLQYFMSTYNYNFNEVE